MLGYASRFGAPREARASGRATFSPEFEQALAVEAARDRLVQHHRPRRPLPRKLAPLDPALAGDGAAQRHRQRNRSSAASSPRSRVVGRLDRFCFASMLGGPERRTLFMLAADWRGLEKVDDVVAARTGQVLIADASIRSRLAVSVRR